MILGVPELAAMPAAEAMSAAAPAAMLVKLQRGCGTRFQGLMPDKFQPRTGSSGPAMLQDDDDADHNDDDHDDDGHDDDADGDDDHDDDEHDDDEVDDHDDDGDDDDGDEASSPHVKPG